MAERPLPGTVAWLDLTVPDAEGLRGFYQEVCGWKPHPVEMEGDSDYAMLASDGNPVAGVCHARGENAKLPPQWLIYVTVLDLDVAMASLQRLGGSILDGPRAYGDGRFCVVRDPAGAPLALFQP